jgi:hypothetical protein
VSGHDDDMLMPIEGFFTDVFEAESKPPRWVIENLLPVGLVFIGAPPKSYKSTITMAMSALVGGLQCSTLPPDLSKSTVDGVVMVFSAEADAGELRFMLENGLGVKGKADGSLLICDNPWAYRLDEDTDQRQLLFWLNQRKPSLVIIDPLRNFHTLEEKDSAAMIRILGPLREWAVKNAACLIIVHHTRKLEEGSSRTYTAADMRGSSALFGLADGVLMVTPGRGEMQVTMDAVFKRAAPWNKNIQLSAYGRVGEKASEAMQASHHVVLNAVAHGYATSTEVAQHTGMSERAVKQRMAWLARNALIKKKGRQWVVNTPALPKEAP